ncbi:hypothetical protein DB30_06812 [Enhygromyxa salina]|uniref:NHL repeat protein n=1 Tax=Enhygromyxa salina TaxID=215803 RepID=A0A0C1ZA31_9BACT|nr:hypothetical protein [Enhygromyxa salina]KIG14469.1 hypothetical protein DB30_06812 [Enhygromyxa salina]
MSTRHALAVGALAFALSVIALGTACGGPPSADASETTPTSSESGGESYDCADLPAPRVRQLDGPIGAADIAFDPLGNLIGSNTQDLFRATSATGQPALWVPGIPSRAAVRQLSDGRLAVVQEMFFRVLVLTPDGSSALLAGNLEYPFGLVEDRDGNIFIGDEIRVMRVDAASGEAEVWLETPDFSSRWLSFDRDYDGLFIGGRSPTIYRVPISATGEAGTPVEWGTLPLDDNPPLDPSDTGTDTGTDTGGEDPGGSETGGEDPGVLTLVDGLGVDACGNVYAAEFHSRGLYKIPAGGGLGELFVDWNEIEYGHGLQWGSGIGEWSETSLFLPQPYNEYNVIEVEIGVPSKQ